MLSAQQLRSGFIIGRISLTLLVPFSVGCTKPKPIPTLYETSSPVIYDNDEVVDVYTDEYLMALAALGEIQLKGMIHRLIAPENHWVTAEVMSEW
jgi:hypothetical protein